MRHQTLPLVPGWWSQHEWAWTYKQLSFCTSLSSNPQAHTGLSGQAHNHPAATNNQIIACRATRRPKL